MEVLQSKPLVECKMMSLNRSELSIRVWYHHMEACDHNKYQKSVLDWCWKSQIQFDFKSTE